MVNIFMDRTIFSGVAPFLQWGIHATSRAKHPLSLGPFHEVLTRRGLRLRVNITAAARVRLRLSSPNDVKSSRKLKHRFKMKTLTIMV